MISIKNRHDFNKAVLTFKALKNLTPDYIAAILTPISETRDRTLRSTNDVSLLVPRSRTSVFDRSFSVSAPKLWNSIPSDIKASSSLAAFKLSVKSQFLK